MKIKILFILTIIAISVLVPEATAGGRRNWCGTRPVGYCGGGIQLSRVGFSYQSTPVVRTRTYFRTITTTTTTTYRTIPVLPPRPVIIYQPVIIKEREVIIQAPAPTPAPLVPQKKEKKDHKQVVPYGK